MILHLWSQWFQILASSGELLNLLVRKKNIQCQPQKLKINLLASRPISQSKTLMISFPSLLWSLQTLRSTNIRSILLNGIKNSTNFQTKNVIM